MKIYDITCLVLKEVLEEKEKQDSEPKAMIKKVSVWAQDIKGIIYFIDKTGNVYDPQHVHQNLKNPNIIAKWKKDSQGNYTIPDIF